MLTVTDQLEELRQAIFDLPEEQQQVLLPKFQRLLATIGWDQAVHCSRERRLKSFLGGLRHDYQQLRHLLSVPTNSVDQSST